MLHAQVICRKGDFFPLKLKRDSIYTEIKWEKYNEVRVITRDSALASQDSSDLHIKASTREMLKTL